MLLRSSLALLSLVLFALPASAQIRHRAPTVALPPISLATPGDALAIDTNPADLAFLAAWSLAFVHAQATDDAPLATQGDALYGAMPLAFGFTGAASFQNVRPTRASGAPGPNFGSGALAFGWRASEHVGLGASLRFFGPGGDTGGVVTGDLAATWRPVDQFALAFLVRDLTGPPLAPGSAVPSVPRSFVLATTLRPLGDNVWNIDLAGAVDTDGQVGGRVQTDVLVPPIGRFGVAFQAARRVDPGIDAVELSLTAGVQVQWDRVMAGGGVIGFGDPNGLASGAGGYGVVRLEGIGREGIPRGRYILDLRVGGLDTRRLIGLSLYLARARRDPDVAGVLLRLRGAGVGMALAQEVRLLITSLQRAGKKVVCHFEQASGSELYACAGADAVFVDPAGGVRLVGPSSEVIHLGETLRDLGVRADFVRIGVWKSAPEQLTNDAMSDEARAARNALLDTVYARFTRDLGRDYGLTAEQVATLVDGGPYLTHEARDAGLIDRGVEDRLLAPALRGVMGGDFPRQGFPTDVPDRWGQPARVGVVVIDGDLVDGEDVDIPLVDIHMTGSLPATRAIEALVADPSVTAIVLRIDSPGGSALASEQLWRTVRRAREVKPVIASFGGTAASGGYYVGCAADEIWADPATITGSIGIFYGKVDVVGLADRVGVHVEVLGRGAHAGSESLFRPYTDAERELLVDKIRTFYRLFLERVAEGRGMTVEEVHEVAQGRVWTGDAASRVGLVDHLGGFHSALQRARELGGVSDEAGVVVLPRRPNGLLELALAQLGGVRVETQEGLDPSAAEGATTGLEAVVPRGLADVLQTLAGMARMEASTPMARLPEDFTIR